MAAVAGQKSWHFSSQVNGLIPPGQDYKLIQAPMEDLKRVSEWYMRSPHRGYSVKNVEIIHNPQMGRMFEGTIALLENRHSNKAFNPKWETEENPALRRVTLAILDQNSYPHRDPYHPHVRIAPMWHGTREEYLDDILKTGFANLALTDSGYFGKGIYGTGEASYAHRVYSKGALLINWMVAYSSYPVIDGDMIKLQGKGNYGNYDAHFAPVVPLNPLNPQEVSYSPCKPGQKHVFTEWVVFNPSQVLPRYRVHLQADLLAGPGAAAPSLKIDDLMTVLLEFQATLEIGTELYGLIENKLLIYGSNNRALNKKEEILLTMIKRSMSAADKSQKKIFENKILLLLRELNISEMDDGKVGNPNLAWGSAPGGLSWSSPSVAALAAPFSSFGIGSSHNPKPHSAEGFSSAPLATTFYSHGLGPHSLDSGEPVSFAQGRMDFAQKMLKSYEAINYKEVIKALREGLNVKEADRNLNAKLYLTLAEANRGNCDSDECERAAREGLALNASDQIINAKLWVEIAYALHAEEEYVRAEAAARSGLRLLVQDPQANAYLYGVLCMSLNGQKRVEEANAASQKSKAYRAQCKGISTNILASSKKT
jgi:hypothetical protein